MRLGPVEISGKLALAPLSGITDLPFRLLCKEFGADLVYTEFVSADGLSRGIEKSFELARFRPEERPIGIQIFGDEAEVLADSAKKITDILRPDFIDLNFGCPVKKVVKRLAGSAVLRDLKVLERLSSAVVKATSLPVTAKIRSGWDLHSIVAVEACRILENVGISAVTLHPRTRSMMFSGRSDWDLIRQCVEAVKIPVIGNGDVVTPLDAQKMLEQTGCAMVMIGRGAMGRPWIFRHIHHFLATGQLLAEPSHRERFELLKRHLDHTLRHEGTPHALVEFRRHMSHYLKGIPHIHAFRPRLLTVTTPEEIHLLLEEFHRFLESRPPEPRLTPTIPEPIEEPPTDECREKG